MSIVQAVLFDKKHFNITTARKWLASNKLKANGKAHVTTNYIRMRQVNPNAKKKHITKQLTTGVKAIIEY